MKTDLYTKTILTIIAVALVILAFQNTNVVPKVHAQEIPVRAISSGPIDVNIVSIDGRRPFATNGSLQVTLNSPLEIKAPYGGLDVNVQNSPDVYVKNRVEIDRFGTLDVRVENYRDFDFN